MVGAVMIVGIVVAAASIHAESFVAFIGTSHHDLDLSHEFR